MKPVIQTCNKINTIEAIQHVLNFYFKAPPIPLNSLNEFTFLVAVVLSAQTTDGIVNQVTQNLFPIASTPELLSNLVIPDVQRIIQPVGLANKKAEYLVNLSKKLVGEFGGQVPSTFRELESLPGVGHKTASVIMSQVFGVPSIAVDTHVHRLSLRWGLTKEKKNPSKVQADLCKIFPEDVWNKLHLQMIYFGREYCTAKNHQNHECPMCSWINKDEVLLCDLSETALNCFQSKPRTKGIVYYSERMEEMKQQPVSQANIDSGSLVNSPSRVPVSPYTQSMTNLMGGYSGGTGQYKSPVRCSVAESKTLYVDIKEEEKFNSMSNTREEVRSVNFLEEFGYKDEEQKVDGGSGIKISKKRTADETSLLVRKQKRDKK